MKTLTETSAFDATIQVPEDGIDAMDASTTIEPWAQKLTNRSKFLNDTKVTGPGSATANALVRYDSTTGKLIKNGTVTENDTGSLAAVENITLSGEVSYTSPKARTTLIPLWDVIAAGANVNFLEDSSVLVGPQSPGASSAILAWPVRLPAGAVVTSIDFLFDPNDGSPTVTCEFEKRAPNFATPGVGTGTSIGSVSNSGTAYQTRSISGLSETIDNSTTTYWMRMDVAAQVIVAGIRVNWNHPSLRND